MIVGGGGESASIVAKLRELEACQHALGAENRRTGRPIPQLAPAAVENRLAEWLAAAPSGDTQSRAVLQRMLRGRITFKPREDGRGYGFECQTRFDKLFSGVTTPIPAWMERGDWPPEPRLTSEDTFDADYGRLLERAYQNVAGAGPDQGKSAMRSGKGTPTQNDVLRLASPAGTVVGWQLSITGYSDLAA